MTRQLAEQVSQPLDEVRSTEMVLQMGRLQAVFLQAVFPQAVSHQQ